MIPIGVAIRNNKGRTFIIVICATFVFLFARVGALTLAGTDYARLIFGRSQIAGDRVASFWLLWLLCHGFPSFPSLGLHEVYMKERFCQEKFENDLRRVLAHPPRSLLGGDY